MRVIREANATLQDMVFIKLAYYFVIKWTFIPISSLDDKIWDKVCTRMSVGFCFATYLEIECIFDIWVLIF